EELPQLAAPHHPFRLAVTIVHLRTGKTVRRREVFRAEQLPGLPAGRPFAPGPDQTLPATGCTNVHRTIRCDGVYWFRLFPLRFWDTTRLPDGRYRLRVSAWEGVGNVSRSDVEVGIVNGDV